MCEYMIKKYYELLQTTINFDFINLFRANVIPNLSLVEYVHKDEKPFLRGPTKWFLSDHFFVPYITLKAYLEQPMTRV